MASPVPSLAAAAMMACLLMPGCKRELTDDNLKCVNLDMNPKEVESILGQPTRVEPFEMPLQSDVKTLPGERYVYEQNGKSVVIHFVDGKLVGHDGSFEK